MNYNVIVVSVNNSYSNSVCVYISVNYRKVGLLAKLASQAGYLYAQAVEGTQENVNKAIFEKVWLLVVQV